MRRTDRFRRQHAELQTLAKDLIGAAYRPGASAPELRKKLAVFAGKLRVHAAMETEALYPSLLASQDAAIRHKSERLHAELGNLYGAFDEFMAQWGTEEQIGDRLIRFRLDLTRMLAILGRRMIRENRELYPLADGSA